MTSSTTDPISPSRYVTGHDENGRAVFSFEGQIPTTSFDDKGRKAIFAVRFFARYEELGAMCYVARG